MAVSHADTLYKYPPELRHRALTQSDLLGWGRLVADAFRNRAPLDLVEVYFRDNGSLRLFHSSVAAADPRDNRLMRSLANTVLQSRQPFRFPYYDRELFAEVRYTDVLTIGRSVLLLPIASADAIVGVVALASRVPDVFNENVVPLLREQANAVAAVYRSLFQPGNAHATLFDAGFYFNALVDPVCIATSDCRVLYANDAFNTFYKQHTSDKSHQPDFVQLMGNGAHAFRERVMQALHHGSTVFQHTFLVAGNENRYNVRLQRVDDASVCVWFYNGLDDEAAPPRSHDIPFAQWQVNENALLTETNERFRVLTGFGENELLNRSFFELLQPGQYGAVFGLLRKAMSSASERADPFPFTIDVQTKSGVTLSLQGLCRASAAVVAFYGDALVGTAEARPPANAAPVADLPVGLVVLNEMFSCSFANDRAVDITGYDRRALQTTAFPLLVLGDNDAQRLMDAIAALRGNAVHGDVYTLHSKAGERRVSIAATATNGEQAKRYTLVLHDVTALHAEVQHWKETAHAAQDNQHAEEQYLARMSHEIRTAMNGIVGLTNVLLQTGLPGEQQQILNLIKQSTDNLLVIINDILDLSKIKSGKLQVEKIPVELRVLFENLYAITLPKVGQREIQYTYKVGEDVPRHVETDPVRLNQIMLNLLGNAIKFTDKGKVEYAVTVQEQNADQAVLRFEVRDTGIGIEPQALESVFESYKQASTSTTRHYGGTGLGLPIVKQLVDVMGGRIEVSSTPGRGTVFAFTLPLRVVEVTEQPEEPDVQAASVPPGLRILVADDNYINRLLVIHLLQSRGFEVVEAAGGYEALDKLRDEDIDAVLMDISMPDLDGFETTKLIRRSDQAFIRDVPVIAMTAHGFQEQVNNARDAGMNDYVVKPFRPDALVRTIMKQLGEGEPQQSSAPQREAPLYNLSFLEDYYNNDRAFIRHILGLYVKETPAVADDMQQAAAQRDWVRFKALAHKIKTNVLMLGIGGQDAFFKAASALNPDTPQPEEALALLDSFADVTKRALKQIEANELSVAG